MDHQDMIAFLQAVKQGFVYIDESIECPICKGKGYTKENDRGQVWNEPCYKCKGSKHITQRITFALQMEDITK